MTERFRKLEFFDNVSDVEQLEEGIFLEHIISNANHITDNTDTPASIYGETGIKSIWWHDCIHSAMEEGVVSQEGNVTWNDLGEFFSTHHYSVKFEKHIFLEDLTEMMDDGKRIICLLSDLVLEVPNARTIPGIAANEAVWIAGIDLSDFGNEVVMLSRFPVPWGKEMDDMERWPLEHFLKSWETGGNKVLALQEE